MTFSYSDYRPCVGIVLINRNFQVFVAKRIDGERLGWPNSWQFPQGGIDDGEDVKTAALRELKEETGLTAHRWLELSRLHTSNSVCDELGILYLATDLEMGIPEPESSELLQIQKIPLLTAVSMVMEGRITDSLSQIGLLKAKAWYDKNFK